jgi:ribosomal protein S18 acetylase RimI-like enzyme
MTVEPLTHRDEAAAVASLAAAFAEYPLFPPLCPDPKRRPRVVAEFSRFLFRMAVRAGGAFGTADRSAVACAWPPGCEWPGTWDGFRSGGLSLLWCLGWRASRLLLRWEDAFDAARRKHVPGSHWYVSYLGVRPEGQGKGLSRAVLGPIFEAADRDRVPVYLETVPESNVEIYRRLGFESVGKSELPAGVPNWELRRDPK